MVFTAIALGLFFIDIKASIFNIDKCGYQPIFVALNQLTWRNGNAIQLHTVGK